MGSPDSELTRRYQAARHHPELAVLEGFHALKHALRFDAEVVDVRTRDLDALRGLAEEMAPDVAHEITRRARPLDPSGFDSLAPTPHPTGVIALARRPAPDLDALLDDTGDAPLVLLERPTHHGNIGAAIRLAAAAGAAGVLVTGPHDPWHPAAIRGAAGLQFALPVVGLGEEGAEAVMRSGRPVVALDPEGEPLTAGTRQIPPGAVVVFGSERAGISTALLDRAHLRLSIPMRPGVSSLNLATAVAIALYIEPRPSSMGLDNPPTRPIQPDDR